MPGVTVKLEGVEKLKKRVMKLGDAVRTEVANAVKSSAVAIESGAKVRCTVDTGNLRANIHHSIDPKDPLVGKIAAVKVEYASYVEFGTRPHFPPPEALKKWAAAHGMPGGEYAIARAIARRGTKARPYLYPAYEEEIPRFRKRVEVAIKRAGARV